MKKICILITVSVILFLSACGKNHQASSPNSTVNNSNYSDESTNNMSSISENETMIVSKESSRQSSEPTSPTNKDTTHTKSSTAAKTNNKTDKTTTLSSSQYSSAQNNSHATQQPTKSQINNVNISLSPAPTEVSWRSNKEIYSTAIINNYTITKTDTADNFVLCQVAFNCTKTFDEKGEYGTERCRFKLVIRKNNVIVGTEAVSSALHVSVNQVFTIHWEGVFTPGNNYTIQICDYYI